MTPAERRERYYDCETTDAILVKAIERGLIEEHPSEAERQLTLSQLEDMLNTVH